MPEAWTITFAGSTLLAASEGQFDFEPGVIVRDKIFEKLARATGLVVKDAGHSGARHKLTLRFYTKVSTMSASGVLTRLEGFANSVTEGALVVPTFGESSATHTINNCVVDSCELGELRAMALCDGSFSAAHFVPVTITFVQVA